MALQRSTASFRRQGSSGLIWKDRFFSGEIRNDVERQEDRCNDQYRDGSMAATAATLQRSASDGGGCGHGGRLGEISPALDPPSPKISSVGCGFCSLFSSNSRRRRGRGRRRSTSVGSA
ncbi:hypothetical protein CARUB_v10003694mg [Capsella rubella]|uniref:Uncharacterized protein n=1 Tax=Capsella rubella TaxID=81985 RepID=R0FLV8_9BRAS|nr:uncharacterized protein At1g15400 [Capsella rubella]EOA22956.1 hypothetical protein CARUB_v10003694mg [Capsella rubella]